MHNFGCHSKKYCLMALFCLTFIFSAPAQESQVSRDIDQDLPEWSILVFIQADSNLSPFAEINVQAMQDGFVNTDKVNLLVQWDKPDERKTNRYKITAGTRTDVGSLNAEMGYNPENEIVASLTWMIARYPAKRYAAILWNHGSGIEDMFSGGFTASKPLPKKLSVLTSWIEIPGMESVKSYLARTQPKILEGDRGVLYDYTQGTFLTNQGLSSAFNQIKTLLGRNIDLIGMDACYMAMLEVCFQVKDCANYLVGSEETEPGLGWAYQELINNLTHNPTMDTQTLAQTMVQAYKHFYDTEGDEPSYTQSAIDLSFCDSLRNNINDLVTALNACSKIDGAWSLGACKAARTASEGFSMTEYRDLYTFYDALSARITMLKSSCDEEALLFRGGLPQKRTQKPKSDREKSKARINNNNRIKINNTQAANLKIAAARVQEVIVQGKAIISSMVIANVTGNIHARAHGLSIYMPTKSQGIHASYKNTDFWKNSSWSKIIPM